jgi:hypothetical protein
MTDVEVLELFKRLPKDRMLISAHYVADELGCELESAEERLAALEASGHISEAWGGWSDDEWTIVAYCLTRRGRDALNRLAP